MTALLLLSQSAEGAGPEAIDLETLLGFAIALLIGLLVGVEREQRRREGEGGTGGMRTFVLIAEAGAVGAWLALKLEAPWIFAATGALVAAMLIAGYFAETRADPESIGLTTEISALVVYLLGGAAVAGQRELAVALAIATSAVLAFKEPMHGLADRLGREDLRAGLKLLIATFIVLPVLPNEPVDPWGVLNPYAMWLLVILLSAMSLVGYAATRLFGAEHGMIFSGVAGGLVSSTAVTLSFARQSREQTTPPAGALAAGMLFAWVVMFARIAVAVTVVFRELLQPLLLPLGVMAAATLCGAGVAYFRSRRERTAARTPKVPLKNPFRLSVSIRFALFFAAMMLAVELVRRELPAGGVYIVALLAGLTDVDAITLSMAEMARGGGPVGLAAGAITVAVLANTAFKCGLVLMLGSTALRRWIGLATALVAGSGLLALWAGAGLR